MQDITVEEFCRSLSRFVVGTEGNLSYRTANGFCIKRSGTSLGDCLFVECDIDGIPVRGTERPSMEAGLHSLIYKNTNCNFIAHTHPTNTLKILCSDFIYEFANKRLFPDQVVFNGPFACVLPYATPGESLTMEFAKAFHNHPLLSNLFLLQNHGIVCCAHSMRQAVVMTEICEKAAEVFLGTQRPNFLTTQQVLDIECHKDEAYRRSIL